MTASAKPRTRRTAGTHPNGTGGTAASGKIRVPYDDGAEAALLGAAFLKPAALEILATRTRPDDYYRPAHAHIAAALTTAHAEGWEANPATIAAELAKHDLLDTVGGAGVLVQLQSGTPSTTAAGRYAQIIVTLAQERRLHGAGRDLADAIETGDDIRRGGALERLADLTAAAGGAELIVENMADALAADTTNMPTILARCDGRALLYPGCVNVLQSEPTIGKSWVALLASVQVMDAGGTVVYLDYEDTVRTIANRLTTLGATPEIIISQFRYIHPDSVTAAGVAAARRLVETDNADLVVIDGVADAIAAQGLDENAASDVLSWWNLLPRPLAATGACVLLLDHVTKSKENRGRWSRGSGAKLGAVDGACYMLDPIEPLSRQRVGRLRMIVSKDRHGHIGPQGAVASVIELRPQDQGERITYDLDATDIEASSWAGPTDCMATVRRLFTEHPDLELSGNAVATQLKALYGSAFRRDTVIEAAERLTVAGELAVRVGPRNGRYYRLGVPAGELGFDDEGEF